MRLLAFIEAVRDMGFAGAALFGAVYVVAVVAMVPGSILTLAAGFLYGPVWGTALISPASVLGAALAFLLGRSVARGWVEGKLRDRPRFRAVDRAVESGAFRVVLLLRLSPLMPFNLLNYALGLTGVPFWKYVTASAIGMLPGTVLYVYLGSTAANLAELASGGPSSPLRQALFFAGLVATAVVTWWITRVTKRQLATLVEEP